MPSETLTRRPGLETTDLANAIEQAAAALQTRQHADGHWVFELEADATIPAEYILLEHYLDRIDEPLQAKIGVYLRSIQSADGGWPLFHDGAANLSATVKAYFALKALGDDPDAPHMARARRVILAAGGAERTNVFTRIQLALFGQVPWEAVPVMPVEIMHLPRWFFFDLSKISYWSRTVTVPLLVLMTLRPRARNPRNVSIAELFVTPPSEIRDWIRGPYRSAWGHVFRLLDAVLRPLQRFFPARTKASAIKAAMDFVTERLNGEDGLGAIYPAMANTVMMFDALGVPPDEPRAAIAWRAVRKLLVVHEDRAYCQPCLSPVWDTGLAGHAIAEAKAAALDGVERPPRSVRIRAAAARTVVGRIVVHDDGVDAVVLGTAHDDAARFRAEPHEEHRAGHVDAVRAQERVIGRETVTRIDEGAGDVAVAASREERQPDGGVLRVGVVRVGQFAQVEAGRGRGREARGRNVGGVATLRAALEDRRVGRHLDLGGRRHPDDARRVDLQRELLGRIDPGRKRLDGGFDTVLFELIADEIRELVVAVRTRVMRPGRENGRVLERTRRRGNVEKAIFQRPFLVAGDRREAVDRRMWRCGCNQRGTSTSNAQNTERFHQGRR